MKEIPSKIINSSLTDDRRVLNSIGLHETICSSYPDRFYLDTLKFFQQWFVAKKMNAQICTHYAGLLLDTINILAYEYAAIFPKELSKELVAWIYANSASAKSNAEFFELRYRNQDLTNFLNSKYTPTMYKMRLDLSRATSLNSKVRILGKIRDEVKHTGNYLSENWTDAIKIGAGSLIATFVNPLTWVRASEKIKPTLVSIFTHKFIALNNL